MFYILSKMAAIVLAPLNLVFLLLAGGAVMWRVWPRVATMLGACGFLLLLALGVFPVGHNMLVTLEGRLPAPQNMPARVHGILVLGGAVDTRVSAARGVVALTGAAERIFAGVELSRTYPEAVLAYSGGDNEGGGANNPEAPYIEAMLNRAGIDTRHVFFEDESRNTHENIVNAMRLFMPQPDETWVLVTSAWHMPRAAAVIHSMGWPGKVVYWPVDYRTDGKKRMLPRTLDVRDNMNKAAIALHERWGWLVYRLTGRINPRGEKLER